MSNRNNDPRASKHAKKRIKERCGISKSSADRVAELALERGTERKNTKGSLRKWLDVKYSNSEADSRIVVWGDKAYVYSSQNIVVTCLQIPAAITRKMKKMMVVPQSPSFSA